MPNFFGKGSLLKHRNLGHLAHVKEVLEDGTLHLAWAEPGDPMAKFMLDPIWTVTEVVREFTPVIAESRMDLLLLADILPEEE